jgi:hypothetical protein
LTLLLAVFVCFLRTLHTLHHYRATRAFDKHKALLRAWAAAIDAAARAAPTALPEEPTPPASASSAGAAGSSSSSATADATADASDGAPAAPPTPTPAPSRPASAANTTVAAAAFAGASIGLECELDILQAAAAMLQERLLCYAARGKPAKAAALASGPLLCVACRSEAFPLRGRPGAPGAVLPSPPAWNAADSGAQLWAQARAPGAAARALLARVGLQAVAVGYAGWVPPDREAFPPELPYKSFALSDAWKAGVTAATAPGADKADKPLVHTDWLPPAAAAQLASRAEAVLASADAWVPAFTAGAPPPCAPLADAPEGAAHAMSMALLPLANALMACGPAARAADAARAARAGAMLCGAAGMVANQGEALHLLGAALFHCGPASFAGARASFAAAAAAKEAAGAAAPTVAREPADANAAAGLVETLLFLAKLQWELQAPADAEATHGRALNVARGRLGDGHNATKKAIMSLLDLKQKRKALEDALARAS